MSARNGDLHGHSPLDELAPCEFKAYYAKDSKVYRLVILHPLDCELLVAANGTVSKHSCEHINNENVVKVREWDAGNTGHKNTVKEILSD